MEFKRLRVLPSRESTDSKILRSRFRNDSFARSLDRDCRTYATCVDPTRLLGIPIGACRQEDRDPLFRRSRKCGDRNDTTETARATGDKVKNARTSMMIGQAFAGKRIRNKDCELSLA